MDEITEREIVEAAKAMYAVVGWAYLPWDNAAIEAKWVWLQRAYAALRAARKVRG